MREIKFRGIRKGSNEFLYGDLNHIDGKVYIFPRSEGVLPNSPDWFEVDPDTVGQFTGLTDKNGVEIYEWGIVKTATGKPMVVDWSEKFASFTLERDGWSFSHWFGESCNPQDVEIIGNIYKNPELLK